MRIEAAVEADHQLYTGLPDHLQAIPDAGKRQVDRLLAEDCLARAREALDQVCMGVGRRADDDRIDILRGLDFVDRADLAAIPVGDRLRRLLEGIGDGDEARIGIGGDGAGMNLADASGAEKGKA